MIEELEAGLNADAEQMQYEEESDDASGSENEDPDAQERSSEGEDEEATKRFVAKDIPGDPLVELDAKRSLRENLIGRTIVEFPSLYVLLPTEQIASIAGTLE
mmetsp:Transcript_65396/g.121936  ORF Transcript_65396/g.121936 Transcript_65396/m.121936 type:complete len:103 (+) Transcript_65396:223-531(+)